MVLRFPLTSAASTKGLHRYSGFCAGGEGAKIELGATASMLFEEVGDFLCTRCVLHATDRLYTDKPIQTRCSTEISPNRLQEGRHAGVKPGCPHNLLLIMNSND